MKINTLYFSRDQMIDTIETLCSHVDFLLSNAAKKVESNSQLLERISALEDIIKADYMEIQSLTRRLNMLSLLSALLLIVTGVVMYVR